MMKVVVQFGCANRKTKGSTLLFYRFPADSDRRSRWITAVSRKDWRLTDIYLAHFVGGKEVTTPYHLILYPTYSSTSVHH